MTYETRRRVRPPRLPLVLLAVAAVLALVIVLVAVPGLRPGWLGGDRSPRAPGAGGSTTTTSAPPARPPADPVLDDLGVGGDQPSAAGIAAALEPLLSDPVLGSQVSAVVLDPRSDEILFDAAGSQARTPASTTKVLTAIAALDAIGPDTRFRTSVVAVGDEIVLAGGGDPALSARTGTDDTWIYPVSPIAQLARETADALTAAATTTVRLGYSADLFSGPAVHPTWPPGYVNGGEVAPVSALSLDGGRLRPGFAARAPDPASYAADQFAQLLGSYGVRVEGDVLPRPAPLGEVVAAITSPTVAELVTQMLVRSDNDAAEMLARHVAVAEGLPATFDGAGHAVHDVVERLGLPTSGLAILDGSGLSRENRISAVTLARGLELAYEAEEGPLLALLPALPVAGFSGTLAERFDEPASQPQAGDVRAKTGYLTRVVTLAGYAVDDDGHPLLFAFLADAVDPSAPTRAQEVVDEMAARVAACGCR